MIVNALGDPAAVLQAIGEITLEIDAFCGKLIEVVVPSERALRM